MRVLMRVVPLCMGVTCVDDKCPGGIDVCG